MADPGDQRGHTPLDTRNLFLLLEIAKIMVFLLFIWRRVTPLPFLYHCMTLDLVLNGLLPSHISSDTATVGGTNYLSTVSPQKNLTICQCSYG